MLDGGPSSWPLPLRVGSALALGLEFGEDDGDDSQAVLVKGEGSRRFRFQRPSVPEALSIGEYLSNEGAYGVRDEGGAQLDAAPAGNDTSAIYWHSNTRGMLMKTHVLDEVLRLFLKERLLAQPSGGGWERGRRWPP